MAVLASDVQNYMTSLSEEFPKLEILPERPLWLDYIFHLPIIRKLRWFNATQTIGNKILLSDRWQDLGPTTQMVILRHEREHLKQFQKYTFIGMAILYLFIFFPVGLAYFRAVCEREGYATGVKAWVEYKGPSDSLREQLRKQYLRVFTGSMYLWMWPYKKTVLRWFEEDWQKAQE